MLSKLITDWNFFCILFSALLIISFIMARLSLHFYTREKYKIIRQFSIMELEFPSTTKMIPRIVKGMYNLPLPRSKKVVQSLKGQLWIDFLFMPAAYGCIFLLCMRVSVKLHLPVAKNLFYGLAFLQIIPWIVDIIENFYLLDNIKPEPKEPSNTVHKIYLIAEMAKWSIGLIGFVCAFSMVCYYLLSGQYSNRSLISFLYTLGEVLLFVVCAVFFTKEKQQG